MEVVIDDPTPLTPAHGRASLAPFVIGIAASLVFMSIKLLNTKQLVNLGLLFLLLSPLASFSETPEWEAFLAPGVKLFQQARFAEAEEFFKYALIEAEKYRPQDMRLASVLGYLGAVYYSQGQYTLAEPLLKRSLAITEKTLGPNDPNVAASLNNLAELSLLQGKYSQAEPLYRRSLTILEKALEPGDPYVASALDNLAKLYCTAPGFLDTTGLYVSGPIFNVRSRHERHITDFPPVLRVGSVGDRGS